jgi:hypothetical protein
MAHLSHPPFKLTGEHIKIARHVHFRPTESGFEVDPDIPYVSMQYGLLRIEPALAIAKILDIPPEGKEYSKVQMDHFKELHSGLAQALEILLNGNEIPGNYIKVTFDIDGERMDKRDAPFFWDRLSPAEMVFENDID